eukprot:m.200104 g.200104  ORF g.200104 m.200104 type:complete len:204 (-) comp21910_c0_seq3:1290-1901(-)
MLLLRADSVYSCLFVHEMARFEQIEHMFLLHLQPLVCVTQCVRVYCTCCRWDFRLLQALTHLRNPLLQLAQFSAQRTYFHCLLEGALERPPPDGLPVVDGQPPPLPPPLLAPPLPAGALERPPPEGLPVVEGQPPALPWPFGISPSPNKKKSVKWRSHRQRVFLTTCWGVASWSTLEKTRAGDTGEEEEMGKRKFPRFKISRK